MAAYGIFNKLVPLLCLALLTCIAEAVHGHGRGGRGHRGVSPHAGHGIHRPPGTIFNVVKYGAKPDGKDSTQEFVKAWVAACHWRGPARLVIPQGTFLVGQVVFQGPCNSPTPIVVEVQGTVKALTDISEYPSPEWFSFESINGLVVTGGGTFNGQGKEVWEYNDCHHSSDCQMLPTNIKFSYVTNGHVRGLHSINSMGFHMVINRCKNFRAHNLKIFAPEDSPNTDGIHISSSSSVKVFNSVIGTGDDCISIGQGTTDINLYKIICGPGHGISVGSLGKYPDEEDVKGITVKNCTLSNTDNGVRIKTWPGSPPSKASTFYFEDIIMNNVKNPIIIDQSYCPSSSCNNKPSRVQVSDVHYKNIRGTSSSDAAVSIVCSPQFPCQNVEFLNINLRYSGNIHGVSHASSKCSNAKIRFGGMQIPPPCQ